MLDKSHVEDLTECRELSFEDTTPLYQTYFVKGAAKHPAKCNLYFLAYLIGNYTAKGDTILDCCAGTGSTGFIGGLLGRKSILIDVEPRYVKWMSALVSSHATILLGDARNLVEGLRKIGNPQVDVILFSPPYADMLRSVEMVQGGFSYSEAQVGRLPLPKHLLEMEKIYRECHAILKPHQKMILVVRNYIRKGSVVDLTYETAKLCQRIGFKLVAAVKLKLPKMREELIEYYAKHPLTPQVAHEYALIFERQN